MPANALGCQPFFKPYIIESLLKQQGFLNQINPNSVNTVRINTLIDGNNIRVLSVGFRTGVGTRVTDNSHSGGIFWQVNPETGQIAYGSRDFGKIFSAHPETGVVVTGAYIPRYQEALDLCFLAHKRLPSIPQIGWDVVISDDYLALIEGNSGPGIHNVINKNEWKYMKKYMYKHCTDIQNPY